MAPPTAPPDEAFRLLRMVDGVTVRIARPPSGPVWGEAEAVVAGTPASVLSHLTDFEQLPRRVPRLDRLRVISRSVPRAVAVAVAAEGDAVVPGEAVVYFHFDLPWPVSDREYTVRYRWAAREGGTIDVAIEDANALGPPAGAIRITGASGGFLIASDGTIGEGPAGQGGRTRLRYRFTADFGGMLPRSFKEETAWRQPLETVRGIRAEMAAVKSPGG